MATVKVIMGFMLQSYLEILANEIGSRFEAREIRCSDWTLIFDDKKSTNQ